MATAYRKTQGGQAHKVDRRPGEGCGYPLDAIFTRPMFNSGRLSAEMMIMTTKLCMKEVRISLYEQRPTQSLPFWKSPSRVTYWSGYGSQKTFFTISSYRGNDKNLKHIIKFFGPENSHIYAPMCSLKQVFADVAGWTQWAQEHGRHTSFNGYETGWYSSIPLCCVCPEAIQGVPYWWLELIPGENTAGMISLL